MVEDEPAVRKMLDVALRHYGFDVREAGGGDEAIEVFERHRDTIDVVLLDVQMPTIDGPQTLAALRALDPTVRVVFMSGNTGDYSAEDLLGRGALHVLQKPFTSMSHLTQTLWQAARRTC